MCRLRHRVVPGRDWSGGVHPVHGGGVRAGLGAALLGGSVAGWSSLKSGAAAVGAGALRS